MKTHARYAFALTLVLGPVGGCGDDSGSSDDTSADGSTSVDGSTSSPTTSDPGTSSGSEGPGSSSAADESGSGGSSSSGGEDPFAGCTRDVLAEDFGVADLMGVPGPPRWYGPGADESGELIDDGQTEYVVSVTYLALSTDADLAFFSELNVANSIALQSNPGMVALQLGGSAQCGSARTFTVWESEEAMMEFVTSEAHMQSVGAFPSFSRGGSTLSVWPETVRASEIDWETALQYLGESETYD